MYLKVCVCVHANWLEGGILRVTFCEKERHFRMDSQPCTRFSGKTGHEPKDSQLTVRANRIKRGRGSGSGL